MSLNIRRDSRFLHDSLWIVSGQGVSALAVLAGTRAVTQFVDPASFGLANLLQNIVALLRSISYAPQLNAGYRFYADAERDRDVSGLRQLLVRRLTRLAVPLLGGLAVAVACWSIWYGHSLWFAFTMAALVMADLIRQFEITLLSAARRQRLVALLAMLENGSRPLLIVALVWWLSSSAAVVLFGVALSLVLPVAILYFSRRAEGSARVLTEPPAPPTYALDMQRYAMGLVPYAALTWIVGVSDRYIIQWLSPNAADVGIYAAGYALISQPFIMIIAMLAAALRPIWFSAVAHGDRAAATRAFRQWLLAAFAIGGLGSLLSWPLAPWVTRTFLAPQYAAAASVMPWIAMGYFFFTIQQVLEVHLLASKRTSAVVVAGIVGALLSIAITIPLVMRFGMLGAAYACPIYLGGQCAVNALLVFNRPRLDGLHGTGGTKAQKSAVGDL